MIRTARAIWTRSRSNTRSRPQKAVPKEAFTRPRGLAAGRRRRLVAGHQGDAKIAVEHVQAVFCPDCFDCPRSM
jgi:hypothetical protein